MLSSIQDWPLLVHRIIDHAAAYHGGRRIVTRRPDGRIVRTTHAEVRDDARRIVGRLLARGLKPGDRVGALAWNTDLHLALWYGVMGAGAVHHTINPRLFEDQIRYIVNDAEDRILVVEASFLPIIERIADSLRTVEEVVVLEPWAAIPPTALEGTALKITAWDEFMSGAAPADWVSVPETAPAGMCYTSGTTGAPKGVVYSHRSNVLHAMAMSVPDMLGISANDVVMPVVPMFHANGWSLAFSAPMQGAAMVMPGPHLDGASLFELMEAEGVTLSAGVPTVWLGLLRHMEETGGRLPKLQRLVIGGSACPRAMIEAFETRHGVEVVHAWGMTETSPLGTMARPLPEHRELDEAARFAVKETQGRPPFTVETTVTDDEGRPVPRDGRTFGRLKVRGAAVAGRYHRNSGAENFSPDGWFDTGDVAVMDALGFMKITDRSKDVIKSGGEWISSIELENTALSHPDVAEAAVVGVPHPKWDERPLLLIVPVEGAARDGGAILAHIAPHVAKWWLPDSVEFVEEIPHTATGKIHKLTLRERYRTYYGA
ncbi:long-chain fatty acid--CoA ligase [Acuticoccus mangrovi]|uniref:3-methylmercaptopropionyl-CoA ligase n=1 Tax=Acuticoccus mangrovi TaxID=2796142 RepID=A0A934MEK3_9HYPH|nr:long-chain fatty acid--CoA ligase [Acuticoccus mangrovi]MBJ3774463.1 long-chain fatty acid--CoA ligase [Acuticoccus mangrovi]